jgi:peptidoglycan glycosyltransferase
MVMLLKKQIRNKALNRIKYIFIGLFTLLIGNMIYFISVSSGNLIINPYNPRMDELEKSIIRGDILDSKGNILAQTVVEDKIEERLYPNEKLFSHIVGYSHQGKTGIEALANISLLHTNLSLFDKLKYSLTKSKKPGNRIVTTLDYDLQNLAYKLIGERKGAIVAIEPSTGKILCMVSKPDFDPNYLVDNWDKLINDEDNSPLLNRATQGLYPPGSIFKIIAATQYIKEFPNTQFEYTCNGEDRFGNKVIHCYNSKAHGKEDLKKAFAVSCNTAFAHIGTQINIDKLNELSDKLLFNNPLPYPLPYSRSSFTLTSKSSVAEISETIIGQGKTLITPLHAAMITSTIANGGIMMQPYLIDKIENYKGKLVEKKFPVMYAQLVDTTTTVRIKELMIEAVNSGTGRISFNDKFQVACKTGSAENPFGKAHAWYVGFAPADSPRIALAIVLENTGTSYANSVPIAKELFELYINH